MESITASKVLAIAAMTLITIGSLILLIKSKTTNIPTRYQSIDIQMHDTYFVVSKLHIIIAISILIALFSLIYFTMPALFQRSMFTMLNNVHVIVSIVSAFIIFYVVVISNFRSPEQDYYSIDLGLLKRHAKTIVPWMFLSYATMIFLFIQLMLIANVILSFWIGRRIY